MTDGSSQQSRSADGASSGKGESAPADDHEARREEANAYVIELAGQTIGIVARDETGDYLFHASVNRFNALEGRAFKTPREAERAARLLLKAPRGSGAPPKHPTTLVWS
jgi:hypothetical protein